MSRQVASRSQRRLEKKQALVLVVLGLVIALVSYGLGVVVGRSGGEAIVHEDLAATERIAIPSTDVNSANEALQPAEEAADPQLTFYDTLPEGKQPPMGSGINMPAQSAEPPATPVDVLSDSTPAVEVVASKPAPVVVKPKPQPTVSVAPQPKAVPSSAVVDGSYIIQVASVQKIDGAQDLSGRLSKSGYPAFVEKTDLGSKGVWYRVYVGPFASKNAADGAASTLKASRLASSPLVRKR
ncbi:MAG: SPOR domain-containing protein [Pedobacter sp.]